MNLRDWALSRGMHPQTAYGWYRTGKMPVPARKVGKLILVGDLESEEPKHGSSVIHARVSSSDQKQDLDRQVARVLAWASEHGYSVDRVVTEVGSTLHGYRRKFLSLLSDPEVGTILVVLRPLSGTGDSSDDGMTHHLKRACKTGSNTGRARRGKNNSRRREQEVRDENLLKSAS